MRDGVKGERWTGGQPATCCMVAGQDMWLTACLQLRWRQHSTGTNGLLTTDCTDDTDFKTTNFTNFTNFFKSDNLDNWDNVFAAQQNTTHFSLKKLSKLYRLSDKNNELRRIARMMSVRQHGQPGQLFCCAQSLIIITNY